MRRAVGPASWAALEVMTARSINRGGDRGVAVSVREVAAALALSKNAAHRAIRRLVDCGVAVAVQHRADDGRFLSGVYRLTLPADVLRVEKVEPQHDSTSNRPVRARRTPKHSERGMQLDLLSGCD